MKTIEGFRMRKLGNEHIVVGEGIGQINFNKMIALNESAAYLWGTLEGGKEFSVETIADLLLERYDIDREVALRDSAEIVEKWIDAGIVER